MHIKDCYQLLNVHEKASDEEISSSYKQLALKYHPDKNQDKLQWANDIMTKLNHAYTTIKVYRFENAKVDLNSYTKGYSQQNKSRAIVVVGMSDEPKTNAVNVPLVGQIAAGSPILAEENIEEYLSFPKDMFSRGDFFALNVKGDSMIEAGIYDGDIAIIKKQTTANSGEIVAAMLEDEATLKRFKVVDNKINLIPENKAYKPIVTDDASILGILSGVFRQY